jgi:hypothetical protein
MSNLSSSPNLGKDAGSGQGQADLLQAIHLELKGIRLALIALVTEGGRILPDDLDPQKQDFSHNGNAIL